MGEPFNRDDVRTVWSLLLCVGAGQADVTPHNTSTTNLSLPPQNIQLRVTVAEHSSDGGQARAVGHVIVGTQATGKALSHWNQMMSALRKPIGMWHPLRR